MKRLFVAAACAMLAAACADDGEEQGSDCGPSSGEVVEVVDGDTVKLADGNKIRYLLVDTPEITKGKNDCYGQEARSFNSDLVLHNTVQLAYDVECKDDYDRLLAYVSIEGREVNALLIERGYGKVLRIPPNGEAKYEEYKQLEQDAKAAGRGLWGACTE